MLEGRLEGAAPETTEEKELAQAFNRGEPGAYEAIYARFHPRVESVCRRMLGNPHDVDEAAQEAFLKVYQALPRFNGRYQLGAWIARITTNVCLDQLRSRNRRPSVPSTLEELDAELSDSQHEEGPEGFVIRRAESRHVRTVLAGLPPMHRAAIVLRDFEGLSYEEVAIALEITDAQCKALIHRARQNFKRSWIPASVAALLPFRFFMKLKSLRKLETSNAAEQSSNVARHAPQIADVAASATQTAASCSSFLGSCGAIVTDKFVGAAATVVIAAGSFALGAHSATSNATPEASAPTVSSGEAEAPSYPVVARGGDTKHKKDASTTKEQGQIPPQSSEPPQAAEPPPSQSEDPPPSEPDPNPSPTEPPTSSGGIDGETGTPPTASPLQAAIGFGDAASIPVATVGAHDETVDCAAGGVTQSFDTMVWDGEASHPGHVTLSTTGSIGFDLTITKDGTDYTYDAGAPSLVRTEDGDTLYLSFSGSYSWIGNNPSSANLPQSGRFDAKLTLDCVTTSVVSEDITLFLQ